MVAGVLGLLPDDDRLFRAFELAEEAGVEVEFAFTELTESRPPQRGEVRADRRATA